MSDKLTEKERLLVLEQFREDHLRRVDSYHNDEKVRHNDLKEKVNSLPTQKDIQLMFIEESRKFVDGIDKKIEHRDDVAHKRMDKIEEALNPVKEEVIKAKAGWKWATGLLATLVVAWEFIKKMGR